jgi:hypothetical protein
MQHFSVQPEAKSGSLVGAQNVKTIRPRRGGNVLVSGATGGFALAGALIIYKCVTAANYQTLEEISRIGSTAKLPRVKAKNFPTF